ncbi:toxin glutamine deamidase domain-containing protein [Antrihabitans stalagmiti]|uniref:toxin glutamine deamidase domain-containing protein n=1 Tax=Antrihabitans stalagmiti TaxID=2799499 RepID=UPI001EEA7AAF|nr:toxin glutamine deamidase domain-containing protein [Antrihabitans stalagmiti]
MTFFGANTPGEPGRFAHRGLGVDPSIEAFGAQRIAAQLPGEGLVALSGVSSHTQYYNYVDGGDPRIRPAEDGTLRSESLANFGRIAADNADSVTLEQHRPGIEDPSLRQRYLSSSVNDPAAGRAPAIDTGPATRPHESPDATNTADGSHTRDSGANDATSQRDRADDTQQVRDRADDPQQSTDRANDPSQPTRDVRPNNASDQRDPWCAPDAVDALNNLHGREVGTPISRESTPEGVTADDLESAVGGLMRRADSLDDLAQQLSAADNGSSAVVVEDYRGPVDSDGVGAHAFLMYNDNGTIMVQDGPPGTPPHRYEDHVASTNVRGVYGISLDSSGVPIHPTRTGTDGTPTRGDRNTGPDSRIGRDQSESNPPPARQFDSGEQSDPGRQAPVENARESQRTTDDAQGSRRSIDDPQSLRRTTEAAQTPRQNQVPAPEGSTTTRPADTVPTNASTRPQDLSPAVDRAADTTQRADAQDRTNQQNSSDNARSEREKFENNDDKPQRKRPQPERLQPENLTTDPPAQFLDNSRLATQDEIRRFSSQDNVHPLPQLGDGIRTVTEDGTVITRYPDGSELREWPPRMVTYPTKDGGVTEVFRNESVLVQVQTDGSPITYARSQVGENVVRNVLRDGLVQETRIRVNEDLVAKYGIDEAGEQVPGHNVDRTHDSAEEKAVGHVGKRVYMSGDSGGHASAYRFTLDQGYRNLFPQDGNFNVSGYKAFENMLSNWGSRAGAAGDVGVVFQYPDGNLNRPEQVDARYALLYNEVAVAEDMEMFDNSPNQKFNSPDLDDLYRRASR